ncbi:MAG: polysaccharide deacetylase family protein [Lachnospiraceae bacterium]|nr:polysaccharide deacetylase family protein [Lachnospiraceae bacterium]
MKTVYTCFPGGKHKALTMSYDDGRPEDRRLVELFNEYGIRGTFNLNSGLTRDGRILKEEWKELYRGHEVACHTMMHPTIARCPDEQILQQVLEDRRRLEAVLGVPVRGLAYPNGSVNDRITKMLPYAGIRYGRTVHSTFGFEMPDDWMRWDPTVHHNHPDFLKLAKSFTELFKTQYLYLMYVWGHSYEFGQADNWEVMEEFCRLTGRREDTWYATNIEIADYMDAAARLQVSVSADFAFNPSAQEVWIRVEDIDHPDEAPGIVCCKGGEVTRL